MSGSYVLDIMKSRGDWDRGMTEAIELVEKENLPEGTEGFISAIAHVFWIRGYAAASGRDVDQLLKEVFAE